jgi:hypothetical protein
MELAVVDPQAVRGCQWQILADWQGMSMPSDATSTPNVSLPVAGWSTPAGGAAPPLAPVAAAARPRELGGPAGPEPTRFGDWEKNGRCIDF